MDGLVEVLEDIRGALRSIHTAMVMRDFLAVHGMPGETYKQCSRRLDRAAARRPPVSEGGTRPDPAQRTVDRYAEEDPVL